MSASNGNGAGHARMPRLGRVLCVDDEEDILEIIKLCLEELPEVAVACCSRPREAVGRAREMRPDIVLLDVMMPGMSGLDVLKTMRQDADLADVPVALMSGRSWSSELADHRALGAVGILPKPFDPRSLAGDVVRLWMSHVFLPPAVSADASEPVGG